MHQVYLADFTTSIAIFFFYCNKENVISGYEHNRYDKVKEMPPSTKYVLFCFFVFFFKFFLFMAHSCFESHEESRNYYVKNKTNTRVQTWK